MMTGRIIILEFTEAPFTTDYKFGPYDGVDQVNLQVPPLCGQAVSKILAQFNLSILP